MHRRDGSLLNKQGLHDIQHCENLAKIANSVPGNWVYDTRARVSSKLLDVKEEDEKKKQTFMILARKLKSQPNMQQDINERSE